MSAGRAATGRRRVRRHVFNALAFVALALAYLAEVPELGRFARWADVGASLLLLALGVFFGRYPSRAGTSRGGGA